MKTDYLEEYVKYFDRYSSIKISYNEKSGLFGIVTAKSLRFMIIFDDYKCASFEQSKPTI